jgi:hypothetical protein
MMRTTGWLGLVVGLVVGVTAPAFGADDASIVGEQRVGIQKAMTHFVGAHSVEGELLHYDPVAGELRRLRLEELHSGIVKKGEFYVSCADFRDESGTLVDVDFLVLDMGDSFHVNQAIVHAVDGKKRAYHLESE